MGTTVVLRPRAGRALGAAMVAVAALALAGTVLGGPGAVASYAAPLALFGLLGWAAFWRPCVEVSDGGVRVVNTLRTVEVAWPALQQVEGRYGLRLVTAQGTVTAWGAQPPSGRARATGASSEAADAVEQRLAQLRAAGFLDRPVLEHDRLPVRWHGGTVVAVATLLVLTLAGALV